MKRLIGSGVVLAALSLAIPSAGVLSTSAQDSAGRSSWTPPVTQPAKSFGSGTPSDATTPRAGIRPTASPSVEGGYVFIPINPFRAFDSRAYSDGYLLAGQTMYFDVLTDTAGALQLPSDAVAVTYNLTVTDTSGGAGYLAIYPADINWPGNSSINWTQDFTTLANGGTVAIGYLTTPGQVEVYNGPAGKYGGTDFIVDITGYYI